MDYSLYVGFWTDWSKGFVRGATLTLASREAIWLTSFITVFITFLTIQIWYLARFLIHQVVVSSRRHDGLHFQLRSIFRNVYSPQRAAWLLLQQGWRWRKGASHSVLRTLPLATLAAASFVGSALLGIFVPELITVDTGHRRVVPERCGLFFAQNFTNNAEAELNAQAAVYATQCYNESRPDSASCQTLPVKSLPWTAEAVGCPFGDDICLNSTAYQVTSGLLDSQIHLGLNSKPENRVQYRRRLTCASLKDQEDQGYSILEDSEESSRPCKRIIYQYGPVGDNSTRNSTYFYDVCTLFGNFGYWVYLMPAWAGNDNNMWKPIPALAVDDGDVPLMFISLNSIKFQEPNYDLIFRTTPSIDGSYEHAINVAPFACVERHQMCNPNGGGCTPWMGALQLMKLDRKQEIGLNDAQLGPALLLSMLAFLTDTWHTTTTRTSTFLKASEKVVNGNLHQTLPDNQWQIETEWLLRTSLARLQHDVLLFTAGPPDFIGDELIQRPWLNKDFLAGNQTDEEAAETASFRDVCDMQVVRGGSGGGSGAETQNFSVLALALLLGLGLPFVALAQWLPDLVRAVGRWIGGRGERSRAWQSEDELLQLVRLLFQTHGRGEWEGETRDIPTTKEQVRLAIPSLPVETELHS